jgi:hypothetical protein
VGGFDEVGTGNRLIGELVVRPVARDVRQRWPELYEVKNREVRLWPREVRLWEVVLFYD